MAVKGSKLSLDLSDVSKKLPVKKISSTTAKAKKKIKKVSKEISKNKKTSDHSDHSESDSEPENSLENKMLPQSKESFMRKFDKDGHIIFNKVSLEFVDYPKLLTNVSFEILPGERVGIVGEKPSDTNAIAIALYRSHNFYTGDIIIDGEQLSTVKVSKCIYIIYKNPIVHSETIRDNVDPFKSYSDYEIWDALERVNIKSKLLTSELDEVADLQQLSIIERQLFFLSIAVLMKPKVIIVKEVEDLKAAEQIDDLHEVLNTEFKNTTVIYLAVHQKTIRTCDKVYFLENGKVVEEGVPTKLLKDTSSKLSKLVVSVKEAQDRKNELMNLLVYKNAILNDEKLRSHSSLFSDKNKEIQLRNINLNTLSDKEYYLSDSSDENSDLPFLYKASKDIGLFNKNNTDVTKAIEPKIETSTGNQVSNANNIVSSINESIFKNNPYNVQENSCKNISTDELNRKLLSSIKCESRKYTDMTLKNYEKHFQSPMVGDCLPAISRIIGVNQPGVDTPKQVVSPLKKDETLEHKNHTKTDNTKYVPATAGSSKNKSDGKLRREHSKKVSDGKETKVIKKKTKYKISNSLKENCSDNESKIMLEAKENLITKRKFSNQSTEFLNEVMSNIETASNIKINDTAQEEKNVADMTKKIKLKSVKRHNEDKNYSYKNDVLGDALHQEKDSHVRTENVNERVPKNIVRDTLFHEKGTLTKSKKSDSDNLYSHGKLIYSGIKAQTEYPKLKHESETIKDRSINKHFLSKVTSDVNSSTPNFRKDKMNTKDDLMNAMPKSRSLSKVKTKVPDDSKLLSKML